MPNPTISSNKVRRRVSLDSGDVVNPTESLSSSSSSSSAAETASVIEATDTSGSSSVAKRPRRISTTTTTQRSDSITCASSSSNSDDKSSSSSNTKLERSAKSSAAAAAAAAAATQEMNNTATSTTYNVVRKRRRGRRVSLDLDLDPSSDDSMMVPSPPRKRVKTICSTIGIQTEWSLLQNGDINQAFDTKFTSDMVAAAAEKDGSKLITPSPSTVSISANKLLVADSSLLFPSSDSGSALQDGLPSPFSSSSLVAGLEIEDEEVMPFPTLAPAREEVEAKAEALPSRRKHLLEEDALTTTTVEYPLLYEPSQHHQTTTTTKKTKLTAHPLLLFGCVANLWMILLEMLSNKARRRQPIHTVHVKSVSSPPFSKKPSWIKQLGNDVLLLVGLVLTVLCLGQGCLIWSTFDSPLRLPSSLTGNGTSIATTSWTSPKKVHDDDDVEDKQDDCIYVTGGGFSGFWFSLGRLSSLTPHEMTQERFTCYSAGCLAVVSMYTRGSSSNGGGIDGSLDDLYQMARQIQDDWNQGTLHRYHVVEAFVDGLLEGQDFSTEILQSLHILTTTTNAAERGGLEAVMRTPRTMEDLRLFLRQTTWIPLAVGSEFALQGHLDGAFSVWQHPTCKKHVGLASTKDYSNSLALLTNTLNVNLGQQHVEQFWKLGLEYGI